MASFAFVRGMPSTVFFNPLAAAGQIVASAAGRVELGSPGWNATIRWIEVLTKRDRRRLCDKRRPLDIRLEGAKEGNGRL
eukprot:scaffold140523_cov30-Tisochrysis_lutea.AAC.3